MYGIVVIALGRYLIKVGTGTRLALAPLQNLSGEAFLDCLTYPNWLLYQRVAFSMNAFFIKELNIGYENSLL
jgi:hypothetical protein